MGRSDGIFGKPSQVLDLKERRAKNNERARGLAVQSNIAQSIAQGSTRILHSTGTIKNVVETPVKVRNQPAKRKYKKLSYPLAFI